MNGIDLIRKERKRQIEEEGFTPEHDDCNARGNLAEAACYYAHPLRHVAESMFPVSWGLKWANRGRKGRVQQLAISGALIAAEIDRELRIGGKKVGGGLISEETNE